jgi:hypothetical protein
MSGIAKPCLFFSTATGAGQTDDLVPVEQIIAIEDADIPANGNNPAEVRLKVVLLTPNGEKVKYFNFANDGARDTARGAAKTLVAASV